MKIGIYLAYEPGLMLNTEGLGKHLALLMEGFFSSENTVVVGCPEWVLKSLHRLLSDNQIDSRKIELITTRSPASFRLIQFLRGIKKSAKPKRAFRPFHFGTLQRLVSWIISIPNTFAFFLFALFLAVIALVLAIPALLFVFLLIMKKAVPSIARRIQNWLKREDNETDEEDEKDTAEYASPLPEERFSLTQYLKTEFEKLLGSADPLDSIYKEAQRTTQRRLVQKINQAHGVDIWYAPNLSWPLFSQIVHTKVRVCPDLVTSVFATGFAEVISSNDTTDMRNTVSAEDYFITYSDYVKKSFLLHDFCKKSEDIVSIPHGNNDLSPYIDIYSNTKRLNFPTNVNYLFARNRLNLIVIPRASFAQTLDRVAQYLRKSNWTDVRYIFYASQIRPSKNIITLLRAYEYLLRKRYLQVKLVLTGTYFNIPEVLSFIEQRDLEYDVISVASVPTSSLSVLYACADLVVNPTLYEGGFPFTFSEGMSVGTPSVMSDIPQTREVLDGESTESFLFDPYDWKDMAEKIEYGLLHNEQLYAHQLEIFERLSQRTWNVVAEDYVKAFHYFIDKDRKKKELVS